SARSQTEPRAVSPVDLVVLAPTAGEREIGNLVVLVARVKKRVDQPGKHLVLEVLARKVQLSQAEGIAKRRSLFDDQAVTRKVRRPARERPPHALLPLAQALPGKGKHVVEVDVVNPCSPRLFHRFSGLLARGLAAEKQQQGVVKALHAKAQAIDPRLSHRGKLLRVGASRVGLARHLGPFLKRKGLEEPPDQPGKILAREDGRRPATDVERVKDDAGLLGDLFLIQLNFLFQGSEVRADGALVEGVRVEIAIEALAGAKRNVDVDAASLSQCLTPP